MRRAKGVPTGERISVSLSRRGMLTHLLGAAPVLFLPAGWRIRTPAGRAHDVEHAGPIYLKPQSFSIVMGTRPPPGTNCGFVGCPSYLEGTVTFAPRLESPDADSVHVVLDGQYGHLTDDIKYIKPRGLEAIFDPYDDVHQPAQFITKIQGVFDVPGTGNKTVVARPGTTDLTVPTGATKLVRLEIDYSCRYFSEGAQQHLVFDADLAVTPSSLRYVIDHLQFDDLSIDHQRALLDGKIDSIAQRLEQAKANEDSARTDYAKVSNDAYQKSVDLGAARKDSDQAVAKFANLAASNPDVALQMTYEGAVEDALSRMRTLVEAYPGVYRSLDAYKHAAEDLAKARNGLAQFNAAHPNLQSVPELDQARAEASAALGRVEALEPTVAASAREAKAAADRWREAKEATSNVKALLAKLLAQQKSLALMSTVTQITAKVGQRTVFAATWDDGSLAKILQLLQDRTAMVKQELDRRRGDRDAAEAALLIAQQDADASLDDLVDKILLRADINAGATVVGLSMDAMKGATEGGPVGAILGLMEGVAKEQIAEKLAGEEDLQAEAAQLLDQEGKLSPPDQPTRHSAILQYVATEGATVPAGWLAGKYIEGVEKGLEQVIESFVEDLAQVGVSPAFAEEAKTTLQQIDQIQKIGSVTPNLLGVSKAVSKTNWLDTVRGAANAHPEVAANVAALVTDAALLSLKDQMRQKELEAWGNYLAADRGMQLHRISYVKISEIYWATKKIYDKLLDAQAKFLQNAMKNSLFKVTTSLPFADGSTVSVTTSPALSEFEFLSGYLGGEQGIESREASLIFQAKGLESRSGKDDPRLVQLDLSTGATKFMK